jgi:hypothetical protein
MRIIIALFLLTPSLCFAQRSVDFKGLRVGMSLGELNNLIRSTPWGRKFGDNRDEPFENSPYSTILTADTYDSFEEPSPPHPFHKWICLGQDCLYWQYVDFVMPEDTITYFSILSQPVFEENLNDLVRFTNEILPTVRGQLGNPVRLTGSTIVRLNKAIMAMKSLPDWNAISIAEWRWKYAGGNKHTLARAKLKILKSEDHKYHLELIYSDFTSRMKF